MKHIIAISGGKDSTAMALRLSEVEPRSDYIYISTPTGNEAPEVSSHLLSLEAFFRTKIQHLQLYPFEDGLVQLSRKQKMIPNFRARFCTRELKIKPTLAFLRENAPCVQYVGLRADEPQRDGIYGNIKGVTQRYPLREWGWGIDEVLGYLADRKVSVPRRTDCQWCFFQRIGEWKRLYDNDRESFDRAAAFETEIGGTFRSPRRDTWPSDLKSLGEQFASGRQVRGDPHTHTTNIVPKLRNGRTLSRMHSLKGIES